MRGMAKPDDVSQEAWDAARVVAREATRGAMRDPLMPYEVTVAPYIARAITAAVAAEREACAELCGGLRHEDRSSESEDWGAGTFACQAAIRARQPALLPINVSDHV